MAYTRDDYINDMANNIIRDVMEFDGAFDLKESIVDRIERLLRLVDNNEFD
jgi:hypothetical protein